jgi:CubicO group peptidase (beta-lactamase class C family)
MAESQDVGTYYPDSESRGGWRWLENDDEVQSIGGMDPFKLGLACEYNAHFPNSNGVVIIRHGHLVAEWYENSTLTTTRFDIWSCTKSFTGTAYGLIFEDARQGKLDASKAVDLDTRAYQFIPEGFPLTDPCKERITLRHLLTMTSGIPGERSGIAAIPTDTGFGPFEAALGRFPVKARRWPDGRWTDQLSAEPGTQWDYSDPAMAHLALAFYHITGREMSDFLQERVLRPIGIENLVWDMQGVGAGFIGPHTNAHTGIHVCARELARFGYLMLHKGVWQGQEIVPSWWVELSTTSSQDYNPNYGYTWWVNTRGTCWPGIPADAFACMGYHSNRCYVIPSLDMVVARVGSGPGYWDESAFINRIVAAVLGG